MISLNQIYLQRSGKPLLEGASMQLHRGERAAIIGANGCGKTSLLKLLLGELEQDAGDLDITGKPQIAYMQQELGDHNRPAREYILDGHQRLRELEAQLESAGHKGDDALLAETYAELDAIHGYTLAHQAEAIMLGLGFCSDDYEKPVSAFSGGWQIRLNLARALLSPSDLLLLDEPTNHLDIDAIAWLESWLRRYEGSVLFISHDRDFIDNVASIIHHIEDHKIFSYTGNYSAFEQQRAERLAQQQATFEQQERRAKELQQFIDRFRAKATKAKQAQSRIKALEKMQRVSAVHVTSPYSFILPEAEKTGSPLLNVDGLKAGYRQGDKTTEIIHKANFSILPGMRIGLLGVNGAGKSTLIKTITGQLAPLAGEMHTSEHIKIGYFAQHQLDTLDMEASPLLHLQRISPEAREQELRNFLGSFKINGDMATDVIKHFSGGEKARLALAMIAWQKPNLLMLDEPTNHLDLEMREALADALQQFSGAMILVSHDRYLLRHCVDEFWLINDGTVDEFSGDLEDYHQYAMEKLSQKSENAEEKPAAEKTSKKQDRQAAAQQRAKLAPLKKAIKKLEQSMDKANAELDTVRDKLSDESLYSGGQRDELQALLKQEGELKAQLEDMEMEWFQLEENLQGLNG